MIDRGRLYTTADDFFDLRGHAVMKLTAEAAVAVCEQAARRGFVIVLVEGGISREREFEARLDCIWQGAEPPIDLQGADANNRLASAFISEQSAAHNAFILTEAPLSGYRHSSQA